MMFFLLLSVVMAMVLLDFWQTVRIVRPGSGLREEYNPLLIAALKVADTPSGKMMVVNIHFFVSGVFFIGVSMLLNMHSPVAAGAFLGVVGTMEFQCVRDNWKLGLRP